MKKKVVLKILFIMILATVFSMNLMVEGSVARIREMPIPLAPEAETAAANPETGDNMLMFSLLALISLTAAPAAVTRYKSKSAAGK